MTDQKTPKPGAIIKAKKEEIVEEEDLEDLDIGHGSKLVVRSTRVSTYTVEGITPTLAYHQQELADVKAKSDLAVARVRAQADVEMAKAQYVEPLKVAAKPVWFVLLSLGAAGAWALASGQPNVAIACIVGMSGVGGLSVFLKKKPFGE